MFVQVRLSARNESQARKAANLMGVEVSRVKARLDEVQLYGTKEIESPIDEDEEEQVALAMREEIAEGI